MPAMLRCVIWGFDAEIAVSLVQQLEDSIWLFLLCLLKEKTMFLLHIICFDSNRPCLYGIYCSICLSVRCFYVIYWLNMEQYYDIATSFLVCTLIMHFIVIWYLKCDYEGLYVQEIPSWK